MGTLISIIIPVYNAEKYLRKTLRCVKKQSFKDFECILINDGSSDGSQSIIDEFCSTDERFKTYYKENGGVSSARNLGLEKSVGKYTIFYDADDVIPKGSVNFLYESIISENADMAIGRMTIETEYGKREYKSVKSMVEEKQISLLDARLLWNGSLCNKIFSSDIIKRNKIIFRDYDIGQDILFLYDYIFYCNKIAGCNEIVYRYFKRFDYEGNGSITSRRRSVYIEDVSASMYELEKILLKYLNAIKQEYECISEEEFKKKEEIQYLCVEYIQTFYKRVVRNNIIQSLYRKVWLIDGETYKKMLNMFEAYKIKMFESTWRDIARKESDLKILDGLWSYKDILKRPEITIVISRKIESNHLNELIQSIYGQTNPYFEVIIDGCIENFDFQFYDYKNLYIINGMKSLADFKNKSFEISKGKQVMFIDDNIILDSKALEYVLLKFSDNYDYISIALNSNETAIKIFDLGVHGYVSEQSMRDVDCSLSNKIIRKASLLSIDFKFSNDPETDAKKITEFLNGRIILGVYLYSQFKERVFLDKIKDDNERDLLKKLLLR